MTKLIEVVQHLGGVANSSFELPENRTLEDIQSYYIKYDKLHLSFNDGSESVFDLESEFDVDWKRPDYSRLENPENNHVTIAENGSRLWPEV